MDLDVAALLVLAGIAMGWVNNLAGAGGGVGLVGLELAAGLPTATANASLRLSALAIGVMGLLGFLRSGQRIPRRIWGLAILTVPGAVLGTYLAIQLPPWVYRVVLGTVLVLLLVQQWRQRAVPPTADNAANRPSAMALLLFGYVGLHMGFVQVGFGLVCIVALSAAHSHDLVRVNAAKMAFVILSSSSSVTSFAVAGSIDWLPAGVLACGAGTGSFLASRWSVRKGHRVVQLMSIGICTAVLAHLIWQSV